jgi:hypothetical protein
MGHESAEIDLEFTFHARLSDAIQALAEVSQELRLIQNWYFARKDWEHVNPYNQVQQKLGECLLTLTRLRERR